MNAEELARWMMDEFVRLGKQMHPDKKINWAGIDALPKWKQDVAVATAQAILDRFEVPQPLMVEVDRG